MHSLHKLTPTQTPLHIAIEKGHYDCFVMLIKGRADYNLKNVRESERLSMTIVEWPFLLSVSQNSLRYEVFLTFHNITSDTFLMATLIGKGMVLKSPSLTFVNLIFSDSKGYSCSFCRGNWRWRIFGFHWRTGGFCFKDIFYLWVYLLSSSLGFNGNSWIFSYS